MDLSQIPPMFQHISKRVRKFWAAVALLSAEMAIVLSLFVVALFAFVYIVRRIFILNKTKLDDNVSTFIQRYVSDRNSDIMQMFTFLGKVEFLVPANLLLIA